MSINYTRVALIRDMKQGNACQLSNEMKLSRHCIKQQKITMKSCIEKLHLRSLLMSFKSDVPRLMKSINEGR